MITLQHFYSKVISNFSLSKGDLDYFRAKLFGLILEQSEAGSLVGHAVLDGCRAKLSSSFFHSRPLVPLYRILVFDYFQSLWNKVKSSIFRNKLFEIILDQSVLGSLCIEAG